LDVVSLFTNVSLDLALDSVSERLCLIKEKCSIPRDEFFTAVRFILNSTFFTFNGKIYQQTFGTAMGSPLSSIIADITLQDLENKAIGRISFNLPFYIYYRYVDDIALAAPSFMFNEVLGIFNSFYPRLRFTLKKGVDNKLNFLDVTIIVNNNLIEFDWFHKPFSGRYLNYKSNHSLYHKRGTIGLVDRAFLLSHPRFHRKNFELIVLLHNGYPLFYYFPCNTRASEDAISLESDRLRARRGPL